MATSPDPQTRARLETLFPLLANSAYVVRSGPDIRFNCIAWAVGSTSQWWWPDPDSFWPRNSLVESVEEFVEAFRTQGFEPCADSSIETGYRKIALYVLDGHPTHAARIESNSIWTSKLGRLELIEHHPEGLNGDEYGLPRHFFRKKE